MGPFPARTRFLPQDQKQVRSQSLLQSVRGIYWSTILRVNVYINICHMDTGCVATR